MEVKILLIILIGLLTLWFCWQFLLQYLLLKNKLKNIEDRLKKLEETTSKRMPFRSQEEILNALAAVDVLWSEFHFGNEVVENIRAHRANSLKIGTKREE